MSTRPTMVEWYRGLGPLRIHQALLDAEADERKRVGMAVRPEGPCPCWQCVSQIAGVLVEADRRRTVETRALAAEPPPARACRHGRVGDCDACDLPWGP